MKLPEKIDWWVVETGTKELTNLQRVISSGFPNEGPLTLELEDYFREYFGVKHAILTTSGTLAIFLGLKGIGIGPGHRVGVPNLTFIATANAVALTGATPVLVEIVKDTLCIDSSALEKVHADTLLDAIVPVHVSGRSAFTSELNKIIEKLEIPVVEDAAEAFSSRDPITGKFLGTLGDVGAFSFSPNKILTSGQGGLVITNNDIVATIMREVKDQGRPARGSGGDDLHNSVGFNFKFTDIQAAVLLGQIDRLGNRIEHLSNVYEYYSSNVRDLKLLMDFQIDKGEFPLWPEYQLPNRTELERKFDDNNIGFRRIWHPLSTQKPYLRGLNEFPRSVSASKNTLWLPSAFNLNTEKLQKVLQVLNSKEE